MSQYQIPESRGRRRFVRVGAAALALAGAGSMPARSQERPPVILGTATPGGGFPVYGAALAAALNGADRGLRIETRNTLGSAENIPALQVGDMDLGLVQGEAAYEAFNGVGAFAGKKPANLKIIVAMYSSPGMFVVRADSPYRDIRDLKGQAVAFGAKGSGLIILSRYVLDGIGLNQDQDFKAVYLDHAGDGPAMVMDRRVAALWGGGIGWPGFTSVMSDPAGGRLIAPTEEEITQIRAKHGFLKRLVIPANSYPHQPQDIVSVGSWSFVLSRPDLPVDLAYRLVSALHKSEAALGQNLPQARESRVENIYKAAPRPELIHPGVLRYLKEIGAAS
jgi:TRAP transporter TAXI family solute receptor